MLHIDDPYIAAHCFDCRIGLELESQRTDQNGHLSRRSHPFPNDRNIVRDFGEAQMEINTDPADSPEAALAALHQILGRVHRTLRPRGELLWPFSNPPAIRGEGDIVIAAFSGSQMDKYRYRAYLADKYGKYLMTFSGIHFNYSFPEYLLRRNHELEGGGDCFRLWRDRFYLALAEQVLSHSWVIVALLGASPLTDSSFFETGETGRTVFTGSASLRSGPMGYWNHFTPLLSYERMEDYTASIQRYLDSGLISRSSELYYPVRVKCGGAYSLEGLRSYGAHHIELRMIDLNPFSEAGITLEDLQFLQLFLLWLSARPRRRLEEGGQLQALQNHKQAAGYDWTIAKIVTPEGTRTLSAALEDVLAEMEHFYDGAPEWVFPALACQREKVSQQERRYACRVRRAFGEDYLNCGLRRAREIQECYHV